MSEFSDLFTGNEDFVKEFKSQDLTGQAKKGLAIINYFSKSGLIGCSFFFVHGSLTLIF